MYLTKIEFNVESRQFVPLLTNAQEQHRFVMKGFPACEEHETVRKKFAILYTTLFEKGKCAIIIQSAVKPDISKYEEYRCVKKGSIRTIDISGISRIIENGRILKLSITMNPACNRTIPDENNTGRTSARFNLPFSKARERLIERLDNCADVLACRVTNQEIIPVFKSTGKFDLKKCTFETVVRIKDSTGFSRIFEEGVGKSKAYGCGMICIQTS